MMEEERRKSENARYLSNVQYSRKMESNYQELAKNYSSEDLEDIYID